MTAFAAGFSTAGLLAAVAWTHFEQARRNRANKAARAVRPSSPATVRLLRNPYDWENRGTL